MGRNRGRAKETNLEAKTEAPGGRRPSSIPATESTSGASPPENVTDRLTSLERHLLEQLERRRTERERVVEDEGNQAKDVQITKLEKTIVDVLDGTGPRGPSS